MKGEWMETHWEVQCVLFTPERIEVLPHRGSPEDREICSTSADHRTSNISATTQSKKYHYIYIYMYSPTEIKELRLVNWFKPEVTLVCFGGKIELYSSSKRNDSVEKFIHVFVNTKMQHSQYSLWCPLSTVNLSISGPRWLFLSHLFNRPDLKQRLLWTFWSISHTSLTASTFKR